jgi:hypothetical protein
MTHGRSAEKAEKRGISGPHETVALDPFPTGFALPAMTGFFSRRACQIHLAEKSALKPV